MATLQKIRNKSVLLIAIVGLALLAFIVGDALQNSSSFFQSSRNQIAEINGEPINYKEYRRLVTKNTEELKIIRGITTVDNNTAQQIEEQTWQELLQDAILGNELNKLGISITPEEMTYAIQTRDDPLVQQFFQTATPQQISQWVSSLSNDNADSQQKMQWQLFKKTFNQQNKQVKYYSLIQKSLETPNALIRQIAGQDNKTVDVKYIVKNYSTISDSTIQVSEKEIKDYYKKNKEKYKQEESRKIQYIRFPVEPSSEDYEMYKAKIEKYKEELEITENAKRIVNRSSDTRFDENFFTKNQIENEEIADFAFDGKVGDVYGPIFNEKTYTLAKINETKMLPDSVRARHILITLQNKTQQEALLLSDSIKKMLTEQNADFERLARQYSEDQGSAINGGDLGWFGPFKMVKQFSDTAFNAKLREIKIVYSQYGIHILQVTRRSRPVKKVQLATINLEVTPSQKTFEHVWADASRFVEKINTLEDLSTLAQQEKKAIIPAELTKKSKSVVGISESQFLVKSTFRSDEENQLLTNNNNSPIFEFGENYIIAMLSEINEKGYKPIKKVSDQIKRTVRKERKFEQIKSILDPLIESSSVIEELAEKTDVNLHDASGIDLSTFQVEGIGFEPKFVAAASILEENEISEPIEGNQGVYVVSVTQSVLKNDEEANIQNYTNNLQQNLSSKSRLIFQSLQENSDIVDNRHRF